MRGMRRKLVGLSVMPALCGLFVAAPGLAQEAAKEAVKPIAAAASADVIEPASVEALKSMGTYLAGLGAFELKSTFETELVLDNDQKVDIGGTTSYEVKRPDGLKVELVGDLGSRDFIYDGKQLTVVSPTDEVYGQVDVAPTIKEMLEQVAYHLDIEVPLADLFDYGTPDSVVDKITEGFLVSPATIGGKPSKHWAFRTEGKDFEVWIADGEAPVPLKIVIDDDTQPARPRFEANLEWATDAAPDAADFAFTAPAGYQQIDFLAATSEEEKSK